MIYNKYGKILPFIVMGAGLSGCGLGDRIASWDFDLRGNADTLDTSDAVRLAVEDRPEPDARGVISYSNYQVAVANRGDTVSDIASRVGGNAGEIAELNGLELSDRLNPGEVVALPAGIAAPAASPGSVQAPDLTEIATTAIDRAPSTPGTQSAPPTRRVDGPEPVRHQVEAGETAFSIARLYKVTPRALADWNGLDSDFTVREGQFLLIPIVQNDGNVNTAPAAVVPTPGSGQGTPTPVPPSAETPLPAPVAPAVEPEAEPDTTAPAPQAAAPGTPNLTPPVAGAIIKPWQRGRSEWIEIASTAGTPIKAAADGTVAIISKDTDAKTIMVVRHANNLLTVYVNIADIAVAKGDTVSAGQTIANVSATTPTKLHFELRRGLESIDPAPYLQ